MESTGRNAARHLTKQNGHGKMIFAVATAVVVFFIKKLFFLHRKNVFQNL